MSDVARKKELCIKVIRSHLISCPGGLTLRQLERDYEASESQKLPYRNFGHTDVLSFLKSLPDVVRIDYRSGQIFLYGVADESTQHVKNLVDHQRPKKPRGRPPRLTAIPPRRPSSSSFAARRIGYASATTRRNVFKVLQDQRSGIGLPAFLELFRKVIGTNLNPERQGFRSLPDFFLSMPDVCRLEYGRKDRFGNMLYIYPPKPAGQPPKQPILPSNPLQKDVTKSEIVQKITEKPQKAPAVENATDKVTTTTKVDKKAENIPCLTVETTQNSVNKEKPIFNFPVLPSCQLLKTEILEILTEETEGIWAAKIPVKYKKKYGKELEIQRLGYFTIIEFLSTLSDEVSITRPCPKGDWLLMKRSMNSPDRKPSIRHHFDENLQVTLMEIKELLIKSEEGIAAEKLFEVYERVYRHKIDPEEWKTSQPAIDIATQIEGICIHRTRGKLFLTLTEAERKAMRSSFISSQRPSDAVGPHSSYKLPTLPSSDAQYIDVFVADVTNPEYFMVQICGKKTTGALNELMDQLEKLYCSPEGDKYEFPEYMLKIGQICSAIFPEDLNWHRAVIVQLYESDYVDVLYVDYGSIAAVPVTSLRLLKSSFLQLPAQMVKARLAHIKPMNMTSWTLEARICMLDLCRDRPLVAMITDIQNRVLSLCLCDTTNPDVDLHINDTLVEMKHAVFFPDGLSREQADTLRNFLVQQINAEENGDVVDLDAAALSVLNNEVKNQESMTSESCAHAPDDSSTYEDSMKLEDHGAEGPPPRRYIQKHSILEGKYSLHVINYEGNPMVASFEISRLFRQSADVLRPLLLMNSLCFSELAIGNDDKHKPLFDAIHKHKIPGAVEKGVTRDMICLYRLQDVPGIVDGLGHKKQNEIIGQVVKILSNFDAGAKFWFMEEDYSKMELESNVEVGELEKLSTERQELSARRKILIEQLANESSSQIVDEVVALEQRICDIEGLVNKNSTRPKDVTLDTESIGVCDALVNQYGAKPRPSQLEQKTTNTCTKPDTTLVAEVAPYVNSCDKEEPVDSDLSVIPGAQITHEIVEFTPRVSNAGTGSEPPPLLVPGSSGATTWGTSQMQNIVMDQGTQVNQVGIQVHQTVPDGFSQHSMPFVPRQRQNNSPQIPHAQMPVAMPQWSCVPMQQTQQQVGSPQLFRDAQGQVYVRQFGRPGGNTMNMPQSGMMYTNQGHGMTLQPAGPFPLFMPVQGMR